MSAAIGAADNRDVPAIVRLHQRTAATGDDVTVYPTGWTATLVLSVIGAEGDSISSCVLADHLERFFAISVFKGVEDLAGKNAAAQLHHLHGRCQAGLEVPLLDQMPMLATLSGHADKLDFWGVNRPTSLIEALQQHPSRANP